MNAKRKDVFLGANPKRPRPDSHWERREWRNSLLEVQYQAEDDFRFYRESETEEG